MRVVTCFVVGFLSRNYRVEKHLQIVNEQKRNALSTYSLFTQAASTGEVQNLITAEVVHAAFGSADTGYLNTDTARTIIEGQPALLNELPSARLTALVKRCANPGSDHGQRARTVEFGVCTRR